MTRPHADEVEEEAEAGRGKHEREHPGDHADDALSDEERRPCVATRAAQDADQQPFEARRRRTR